MNELLSVNRTGGTCTSSPLHTSRWLAIAAVALLGVSQVNAQTPYWMVSSAGGWIEHFDAAGNPDGWMVKATVSGGNVNITYDAGNTAPSGTTLNLPLADPIHPNGNKATTLTLTGITGSSAGSPFSDGAARIVTMQLPSNLTALGNYAFYEFTAFNDPALTLPPGLRTIGRNAFTSWTSFNQPFTLPSTVTSLGTSSTFASWSAFNQPFTLPSGVTSIPMYAFSNWEAFNSAFTFQGNVTTVGASVFQYWLVFNQPFSLPATVTSIGGSAFVGWEKFNQPFTIPAGVRKIESTTFNHWYTFNSTLTFAGSVTNIEQYAFGKWNAYNQTFPMPANLETIGNTAFNDWYAYNKLLTFPATLKTAGINLFANAGSTPGAYFKGDYPNTVPEGYTQGSGTRATFRNFIDRANVNSWATGASVTEASILAGTARYYGTTTSTRRDLQVVDPVVTFDAGAGSVSPTSLGFTNANFVTANGWATQQWALPTPTPPPGSTFVAWTNSAGTVISSGANITQAGDFTLYAKYDAIPVTPSEYPVYVKAITVLPSGDVELAWDTAQIDTLDPTIRQGNYHYVVTVCSDLLLLDWTEQEEGKGFVLPVGTRTITDLFDRTLILKSTLPTFDKRFYKVKVVK